MRDVLEERIRLWLEDPDSAVEYAEEVGPRWAVRVKQESRDVTTVWFWPRERSLEHEAYFLPVDTGSVELFRQALRRNERAWRTFFALDGEGGLVLRGRLAAAEVTIENLDRVMGEIVETVDIGFRPMLRAMMNGRETSG